MPHTARTPGPRLVLILTVACLVSHCGVLPKKKFRLDIEPRENAQVDSVYVIVDSEDKVPELQGETPRERSKEIEHLLGGNEKFLAYAEFELTAAVWKDVRRHPEHFPRKVEIEHSDSKLMVKVQKALLEEVDSLCIAVIVRSPESGRFKMRRWTQMTISDYKKLDVLLTWDTWEGQ